MHIATENMWFLRKLRKPFLKPYISIITVISRQLKKERERIQHWMVPQLHVEDRSSRRTTIAFVKGQSVTQNLFFGCPKTFSRASCALKDF